MYVCTHRLFSMSNSLAHHTHWLYSSDFDILDTHSPPKFANNKNIHEFCTLSHWTVEQRTTSTKTTMSLSLLLAIAKGKYEKDLSLLLTLIIFTINVAVSYLYQYRVYRVHNNTQILNEIVYGTCDGNTFYSNSLLHNFYVSDMMMNWMLEWQHLYAVIPINYCS